ncbi:MAG TPA: DUF4239 domain-containing protein [Solirubrobacteraceae bacterium]|nr:DUF4239 domain-containing protein [Solirubrobacteraceae bacterium]
MVGWLEVLPLVWMGLVVAAGVALLTGAIYLTALRLGRGTRAAALASVSPGMLPPLGILFALIVGFMAAGVWDAADRAKDAVGAEASALRSVVLLSDHLPVADRARMRELIRDHIEHAVDDEWPAMADRRASLSTISSPLADALDLALRFAPRSEGESVAQRETVESVQEALDARRQRIIVSLSGIADVAWASLIALAALTLLAMAFVHSANRATAAVAMTIFATAVTVVVVMLLAQDRPFTGRLAVEPDVLEQVVPQGA